jgi:colanic acid/amylovoran biosynthesis glycosyltransferase
MNVAYLTNEFPVAVEPYVWEEISELRSKGIGVTPCSVRRPLNAPPELTEVVSQTAYLLPLNFGMILRAVRMYAQNAREVSRLLYTAASHPRESLSRRIRAVAHTLLGVYYAALLKDRHVEHIHVHHGYFAAWIAMTAARVLKITYSMTLHGSDLLLHRAFLDLKLENCKFCLTVSEFNRRQILANYPVISPEKVRVQRLGVDTITNHVASEKPNSDSQLVMLSVGRLHAVKDHAFLLRACSDLKSRGANFVCFIAGEGPERPSLEKLVREFGLQQNVTLLGHVPRAKLETYYAMCDLAVLTSKSEGIPLTLMEAMAHGRTVLAPAITGIPELVVDGFTGFLYQPGSIEDFVTKVETVRNSRSALRTIRHRARRHVLQNFNRATNLAEFAEIFPALVAGIQHENSLLQQI